MNNAPLYREVHSKQFFLVAFICVVAYKVVMLPQYLSIVAGRQAYWTMAFMMLIELCELAVVYGTIKHGSLLELPLPEIWKALLCLAIFASAIFKCGVLTSETLNYVSTTLFDNADWLYVLLALLPCVGYLAYKGANAISRTSEILFWFLAFAFFFNLMFARLQGDPHNLLPVRPDGSVAVAGDKHLIWFGDFTSLLFFKIVPSSKKAKPFNVVAIVATALCPVLLMLVFTAVYGGGGVLVSNAFGKLSIYNKLSFLLGTVDLPTVSAWLMMAIVKLSVVLYAAVECARYFLKLHGVCAVGVTLTLGAVVLFGMKSLRNSYALATGWLRYVFGAIEYAAPLVAYALMRRYTSAKRRASAQNDAETARQTPQSEERTA